MAQTVTDITIDLLRPFKGAVLTITADIGKEFSCHDKWLKPSVREYIFPTPTAHGNEV